MLNLHSHSCNVVRPRNNKRGKSYTVVSTVRCQISTVVFIYNSRIRVNNNRVYGRNMLATNNDQFAEHKFNLQQSWRFYLSPGSTGSNAQLATILLLNRLHHQNNKFNIPIETIFKIKLLAPVSSEQLKCTRKYERRVPDRECGRWNARKCRDPRRYRK